MTYRSLITLLVSTTAAAGFQVGGEACGQGRVRFNNRIPSEMIDGPVTHLDGTPVGRFTAQLFGGLEGSPVGFLKPLYPTTFFRFNRGIPTGYIREVEVLTTELQPGVKGTFVMRAYDGLLWETSSCRGESLPFTLTLGGGAIPPSGPLGLQPFQVDCIPEPSTWILAGTCPVRPGPASRTVRPRNSPSMESSK